MAKRKTYCPDIELEKNLGKQIFNALQGSVVEQVMKLSKVGDSENYLRSSMEGGSLKVEKRLLEKYYVMFNSIKEKLGFEDPVDFYISGSSEVNAWSSYSEEEGAPHIVNINSALLQLMTDDELAFVVGHELGHLINKNTKLSSLIHFVFPNSETVPVALAYKIRLWEQLAELEADRYGFLAVENLDACVSAFYKLASGLDIAKMNVKMDVLLEENLRHLEYFQTEKGSSREAHPVNPIRVQALNLFATTKSDETLNSKMDELLSILLRIGTSELDYNISLFIASSGLYMAHLDDEVSQEEIELILKRLSGFQMFANDFLHKVSEGDVPQIFVDSVNKILEIDPGLRDNLFGYLVDMVMADKKFSENEVKFLYEQGRDMFGYSDMEIARNIAESIQENFVPDLFEIV